MDDNGMLSIESEEFTRLQTQLIELRTTNYQLKEEKAKADKEIHQLQEAHQNTQKELEKANKSIQRSKKAKEYQLIVEERDSVLNRLHTQEEDFKLQNKTLLDEIANVCEQNEELKKKLKSCESGGGAGEGGAGGQTPEIVRLKAENAALQKSLQANRERLNSQSGEGDTVDSSDTAVASTEEVASLRLSLATLEEEKKLLQEQISTLLKKEGTCLAEIEGLKKEVEKQAEKLRKKQESVIQLQEEKEKLISEHKKSQDQLTNSKDQIIEGLKSRLSAHEQQSEKFSEVTKLTDDLNSQIATLKSERNELQSKFENQSQALTVVTQERDDAKHLLNELSLEMETAKRQSQEEKIRSNQFQRELMEAKQASDDLADQLLSVKEDKLKADEALRSVTKLAESRKSLLDNMAIKEQQTASEQKKREDEMIAGYKTRVDELSYELDVEKAKNRELSISLAELRDLQEKVKKYETIKASHEETLHKLEESFQKEKQELQDAMEQQEATYQKELESIKDQLKTCQMEKDEMTEKFDSMEEELLEKTNSVKIVEKKSSALIKDLKRQLQQFQKREEKLQHQLLEVRGAESTSGVSPQEDQSNHSRESSLSSMRGVLDSSNMTPNTSFQMSVSSIGDIDSEDTQALMDKIAQLQQEKWLLEEKVQHLENTGSALAEDVLQKSRIIQQYHMDNKADHVHSLSHLSTSTGASQSKISPMRLVSWAKTPSKDSEAMAEVNRKMQRALEEALMKNIHLQKDVDMLSAELEKQGPTKEPTPP